MIKSIRLLIENYVIHNDSFYDFLDLLLYKNYISEDDLLDNYGIESIELSKHKSNYIILHKIIIKNKNQGIGTSIMQKLCDWCDEHNMILCLTPDDSFGASSVLRLKRFYNRFGFVDNKGRNIDFNHNESMYRKPNQN